MLLNVIHEVLQPFGAKDVVAEGLICQLTNHTETHARNGLLKGFCEASKEDGWQIGERGRRGSGRLVGVASDIFPRKFSISLEAMTKDRQLKSCSPACPRWPAARSRSNRWCWFVVALHLVLYRFIARRTDHWFAGKMKGFCNPFNPHFRVFAMNTFKLA